MTTRGKKLAWLSDPHLNCCDPAAQRVLAQQIAQQAPDALLLSGDLDEAPGLLNSLDWLAQAASCPLYFVLGNHDFYHDAIAPTRARVREHSERHASMRYLTTERFVSLSETTALVGHDGWGDARTGDALNSPVMLADFMRIRDLMGLTRLQLIARLEQLGDEAAAHLDDALRAALATHAHVLVLSHVPPFVEAAWHEGHHSNIHWSPFFVCHAAGQVIRAHACANPQRRITVLCGHTHGGGESWLEPNLHTRTGPATYGSPTLQAPLWIV
jgi:3',5'-cyclic AMP phosphodiesterase CpdA